MRNSVTRHEKKRSAFRLHLQWLFAGFLSTLCFTAAFAQSCPPNIDFESGNFSGWACYTGFTAAVGDENVISLTATNGPSYNRQTMYSAGTGERDPYGGFPVSCPNGSGHSVKLGNSFGGGEAEGISYVFTIPENDNSFSLIYRYAVVFQAPNHRENEQPRMEIEITNMSDNSVIDCASFTFIAVGTSLPGFTVSSQTDTTTVLYKDWSAVSVDLSGNAGKTIRLFFKTADCTFRRHFGYAYIDVDTECSSNLAGATYCPDDTAVNITAPYGYESYTWYDSAFTRVLGTQPVLFISPPPPAGETVAVKLVPFSGFGCTKTYFTKLSNTLVLKANAGHDTLSCNYNQVQIGSPPRPGLVYRWSPPDGLSNDEAANPFAAPNITTNYVVHTNSTGGGCRTTDTVKVIASIIDTTISLIGKAAFCIDNGDSGILQVSATNTIQWFRNDTAIFRAQQPSLRLTTSGDYYARLTNAMGCIVNTQLQPVAIEKARPGIRYPDEYAVYNLPLPLKARSFGERYLWTPSFSLDDANSATPTFKGATDHLYNIRITTRAECLTVDTLQVKAIKGVELYVPTAFTPNMDGKNDYLRPILRGIKEVRYFRIYSRWGQLLYDNKTPQPGWNGMINGTPQPTMGVVWMLEGVGVDNKVYTQKGTSILLR